MSANMIAGPFTAYWMRAGVSSSAASLGVIGPEGFRIRRPRNIQDIDGDSLGRDTITDGIYHGGNVTLEFVLEELKLAAVKRFLNPFTEAVEGGSTVTGKPEVVGLVGDLVSNYMGTLQLIPVASTPAASRNASGGSGFHFIGVVIGDNEETLSASDPDFVPVRFRAYPFADTGDSNIIKWWKWISAAS